MPNENKPLFHPSALRAGLNSFTPATAAISARAKLEAWAKLLESKSADDKKETELLPGFISDVFEAILGYTRPPTDPYTLKREALIQVDGKFADAGIGRFSTEDEDIFAPPTKGDSFTAVLEGKGPKDPLDRPFGGRKFSAVEQALHYAVQLSIDWYLVTNIRETRLYCKRQDTAHYERFDTIRLARDEAEWRRFVFLLGADRVVGPTCANHLDSLLVESRKIGRELTAEYYREYRDLRRQTFQAIRQHNPGREPRELLATTQKILDRILFIAFCEDRGLLPQEIIARAYKHSDPFNPRPVWENFKGLFRLVDKGGKELMIDEYNGGLFATDASVDSLIVPDTICEGFKKLADYEYGTDPTGNSKLIDVEILGHIFEQSISDLEELQRQVTATDGEESEEKVSKRKREGAFYTPDFVTRYIVAETLGPIVRERFEIFRAQEQEAAKRTTKRLFDNPRVFNREKLNDPQCTALVVFWRKWIGELEKIRVVDPACGSGAFLIEAFDQLFAAYREAEGHLKELGGPSLIDVQRSILTNNLFGMDLNGEAVEIARLSCWIKTAEKGKKLTALDGNIVQGNSVIADPTPFEAWHTKFPEVFKQGGFDVVIGNPPYVRQEWFAMDKDKLAKWFESFDSIADLFTYFYELGVKLLSQNGRMGFITSGSWVRGSFGNGLRGYLAKNVSLESMIDFGEYQPFEDAEMIRPTITVLAKRTPGQPMRLFKWLTAGKPPENLSEVIREAPLMQTGRLSEDAWELESDEVIDLRRKLTASGRRLSDYVCGEIYRGVLTGLTEVFVISGEQRTKLIEADKNSEQIIKPFVQGTNLRPWFIEGSGDFLLAIKSSDNEDAPWSNAGQEAEKVFARTFPAIHEYLHQFRDIAIKRTDQGRFWWELRSCSYWQVFDKTKIVWPDIGNYPRFSMDQGERYLGNTGYTIPRADYYMLGILSSWATWFYLSKTAQPLRLRSNRWQYRLFTQYMQNIPIPDAPETERNFIAELAERCGELAHQRNQLEIAVQHRLVQVFGGDAAGNSLGKLNEKAQMWWEQSVNQLGAALKQSFKLAKNPFTIPKTADEWEPYLAEKKAEEKKIRDHLADAELEISDRVYHLFKLTPAEIKLLQREVEH